MAETLNMAETPLPPGAAVTPSGLVAVGRNAQEAVDALRPPEPPRPPEDPLLNLHDLERIRDEAASKGGSRSAMAEAFFNHYSRGIFNDVPVQDLPPNIQTELQRRRGEARGEVVKLKQELEGERGGNTVLEHFRRAALEFLKRVRAARPQERHAGEDRGSIINRGRHGYYGEVVFDDSPELKELQAKYGRLPSYMFEGVVQEIDKEAHDRPSPPLNPLAEQEYPQIKQRRERERRWEKKYTEIITTWGRYYEFLWPESPRDMIDSTLDFVKDRISEVGNRDVGTVSKLLDEIRGKVVELLETCRARLNSDEWFRAENKEIIETDPNFLRARAFGEGVTDVLGNEKVMYKGNTEYGPQYKERFASEFIAHHDEMYMGNPKAARMLRSLSKKGVNPNSRGGFDWSTYWFGHGWDVEKAEAGEIADYRRAIEEEIVDDAATHDLFLSDDMTRGLYVDENGHTLLGKDGRQMGAFEYREGGNLDKRDLRFSFDDDNIERLLLDPGDQTRQQLEAQYGPNSDEVERHKLRVAVFRSIRERLDEREGLGFITPQERRLLEGQRRRPLTDKELLARAEHHKNTRRAEIQQQLRSQGYSEDQIAAQADQIEAQIHSEMEDQRRKIVRERIRKEMEKKTGYSFFAPRSRKDIAKYDAAKAAGDLKTCNQIVWDWVKDYNEYRISFRLPRWYPSGWDRTRWNIDRPTKVLDRGLSEEEFEAMFEPIGPGKLDDVTISQHKEDARFGFQLARSYQIFLMQDTLLGGMRTRLRDPKTGEYIGKLAADDETNKRLGLIRVDDQGNIIRDAQGNSIAINPDRKMIRVFDVIQARLQAAIEEEAAVIAQARAEKETAREAREAAIASRDQAAIEAKTKALTEKAEVLRDIFVNSQFAATHVLKEIGLVEGKLPVWSYNFLDRSTIYAFTEVLADYGVEVARGVRISHNSKKEFYEYMERGRRALKAEYDRAAQEFMEGRYPVFEREPDGTIAVQRREDGSIVLDVKGNPIPIRAVSLFTAASDFGDPSPIKERPRVVSKGGVKEDTMVTDPMFDISTSGGVIFREAIPYMGDLGFYSMLIWLGVTDIRELHGYIKRRDELEFHRHKFFDVMDPVNHARAQAASYLARRALTGGEIDKKGSTTPGFLMEPFHGAFKSADWLHGQHSLALTYGLSNTADYLALMQKYREVGKLYSQFVAEWSGSIDSQTTGKDNLRIQITKPLKGQDLEQLRQLSYLDLDIMNKPMADEFYTTLYGVLDYFQLALKATKEVQSNRIGNAPRNWVEDNTIKWYRFRRDMREAMQRPDPENGFIIRQGYSPEVASEIAIKLMETVLQDGDFLILRPYERDRRATDGAQILSKMLTLTEREQGFEIKDEKGQVRQTWVIPEEKDWPNLVNPEVRKALETIRRRGLLEFMREEGYGIYDIDIDQTSGVKKLKVDAQGKLVAPFKEVLGMKVPPLVQKIKVKQDSRRVASA